MSTEFITFLRTKRFIDSLEKYLPKLTEWVNDKITFWQTDLSSNILPKVYPSKKCFTTSVSGKGPGFDKNNKN